LTGKEQVEDCKIDTEQGYKGKKTACLARTLNTETTQMGA